MTVFIISAGIILLYPSKWRRPGIVIEGAILGVGARRVDFSKKEKIYSVVRKSKNTVEVNPVDPLPVLIDLGSLRDEDKKEVLSFLADH